MFNWLRNKLNWLSILLFQLSIAFNQLKKNLDRLNFSRNFKLQVQQVEGKVGPGEL